MVDLRTVPPPPRFTGDIAVDFPAFASYMYDVYRIDLEEGDPIETAEDLPSPTNTNLAQAQQTGNTAFEVATAAEGKADAAQSTATAAQGAATAAQGTASSALADAATAQAAADAAQASADAAQADFDAQLFGTVTVSDTDTTGTISFTPDQPNTSYNIVLTASARSGSPAAGAYVVVELTKAVGSCTVTVSAAPGAATSVTFDWQLRR